MLQRITFLFFVSYLFAIFQVEAQSSFALSKQEVYIIKDENFDFAYAPTDIINLTDAPLELVWQRYLPADFPEQWTTGFQDPITWHNSHEVERDTFELKVENDEFDKLIFQVYPNGQVGEAVVDFNIYDANNPSDSLALRFIVQIQARVLATDNNENIPQIVIYPNPVTNGKIFFSEAPDRLSMYDLNGSLICEKELNHSRNFDLPRLSKGLYFLKLSKGTAIGTYKLIIE
ncbi:MAG: T9SS type A sorting domain-containing protein [Bernardetiaceae bacterium]|nr:T9SS type A sorting domain-containing protein [Bernardetiaceae bacterium]